jgi:hypothetical protein
MATRLQKITDKCVEAITCLNRNLCKIIAEYSMFKNIDEFYQFADETDIIEDLRDEFAEDKSSAYPIIISLIEYPFVTTCKYGRRKVVEWMYIEYSLSELSCFTLLSDGFANACKAGSLTTMRFTFEKMDADHKNDNSQMDYQSMKVYLAELRNILNKAEKIKEDNVRKSYCNEMYKDIDNMKRIRSYNRILGYW